MGQRKEPVYRFSGAPTLNRDALRQAITGASSVQFSQGGFLIYAVDRDSDVLADETEKYVAVERHDRGPRITDPAAIAELVDALAVSDVTDMLCMCTGDFAAEFFDENRTLIGVIRIDIPNRIEWPHWPGIAHLADPDRLERWMASYWNQSAEVHGPEHPMLANLVDLESAFDPGAERQYDPVELVRYALGTTAYWAELAVTWLESTEIPVAALTGELTAAEERVYWPQQLRHRARRVRLMLGQ